MDNTLNTESRSAITAWETFWITAICFGWAIFGSLMSVAAWTQSVSVTGASDLTNAADPGFTDGRFISLIFTEIFCAYVGITFLKWRCLDVRGLPPQPSIRGVLEGALLYLVGLCLYWLFAVPLQYGQSPEPIQGMVQGAVVSTWAVVAFAIVNGTFEEVFLLGVLARGLRGYGMSIAIGIPVLVRLLYHLYQGPVAASSIGALGIFWGFYYLRTRRLFPVVFAHILADIVPFMWPS
ncbi:MAG: CPBP family intramembrane glutamic endopeptidase [Pseudomonadota bacterium]